MWSKAASYVSRKKFCLTFIRVGIYAHNYLWNLSPKIQSSRELVWPGYRCCILRVWENFLAETSASKKILFSWIFSDPGRKNFGVLAYFAPQKKQPFCPETGCEEKQFFFQRLISFLTVFHNWLGKLVFFRKAKGLVVKLLFYVSGKFFP